MLRSECWPPDADASLVVSVRIDGDPKPAGSKDTGIVTRFDKELGRRVPVLRADTGMPMTFTQDSSGPAGKNWRSDVRQAIADALEVGHELIDGPLAVRILFFTEHVKAHYGTGRNANVLKDSAPKYPHVSRMADGDKLERAIHDALTKLVWTDDSRVCDCWWSKRYGKPGAELQVLAMPAHEMAVEQATLELAVA